MAISHRAKGTLNQGQRLGCPSASLQRLDPLSHLEPMQSLLFPEFSPDNLEQAALSEWTDGWLASFPALKGEGAMAESSLALRKLMTPLGPMLAVASKNGLVLLEFVDKDRIKSQLARATKIHGGPLLRCASAKVRHVEPVRELDHVEDQIAAYFAGERKAFDLRLDPTGTPFQKSVWTQLLTIPYGAQASYGDIAEAVGRPSASRAVGAANGSNPIAIIQPCHRIIGSDGTLTGYAGGLWRKRRLLELEAATHLND